MSAMPNEKAVATNIDDDGSAPSPAQRMHKEHVISVQEEKTRAPRDVSSCGAFANIDRASIFGCVSASTTDSIRSPATIRSQIRRLDCAFIFVVPRHKGKKAQRPSQHSSCSWQFRRLFEGFISVSMRRLLSGSSAAATGSIRGKLDGAIGRITISNPTKLNAMVSPLFSSLAR